MMPRSLSDLRRYVNRMLRRELGQIHGFARYHFVGDCKFKCGGKDPDCVCGATGLNSEVWHPHLNVVHDHGWIDDIDLDRIKALYQQWLEDYTDTFIPAISVHNTYRNGFDDKILQHKLWRYVGYSLRPTFTKEALDNWSAATGLDGARTWTGWLNTVELGQYPEGEWVPPVHKFRPPVEDVIKRRKGDVVVRATHWFRLHLAGEPTIIDPRVRKFLQRKKVLWALITGQRENKCPTCGARVDWEFMAETRKRWKECKGIFRIDVHEYRNAQAFHCVWLQ